ncbi:MAG: DUF5615 family PIN-like protein [Isosphaeraceae bacterium]
MLRLISDHNFSGRILRGIVRRIPNLDLVRAFDAGLATAPDPVLLEWAAVEDRILLTHDVNTIPGFAYDRVRAALGMPGVFLVDAHMAIGKAIDELVVVIACSSQGDWKDAVTYFPL